MDRGLLLMHHCDSHRADCGSRESGVYAAGDAIRNRIDPGGAVSSQAMGGKAMTQDAHQKVKTSHLKRNAYLYIRQSTLRQVFENTESTQRQ
jgi:hypothetical protein